MEMLAEPTVRRHRITVEQYHRMGDAGVFEPDARVELIEGEVIDMAPIGMRHWSMVTRLTHTLAPAAGERAFVSVHQALRLSQNNEPEPDIALLKPRADFYVSALPTGRDSLLVIEVADSSLDYDLRTKARLYATHGVPEYWVIDVAANRVHLHRAAQGERYAEVQVLERPGVLALPGIDGAVIDLGGAWQQGG
jgi:Uma2 family endonuclease